MSEPISQYTDLHIIGLLNLQAEVLGDFLNEFYTIHIHDEKLDEISRDAITPTSVIIAGTDGLTETPWQAAKRLRTEQFIWQPIFLLIPELTEPTVEDWAIYTETMPPDLFRLHQSIQNASCVDEIQKNEIIQYGLLGLREDLLSLNRLAFIGDKVKVDDIRALLQTIMNECQSWNAGIDKKELQNLCVEIEKILSQPVIEDSDAAAFNQLVIGAETITRELSGPQLLRSSLHQLSNILRLSTWNTSSFSKKIMHLIHVFEALSMDDITSFSASIGESYESLKAALLQPLQAYIDQPDISVLNKIIKNSTSVIEKSVQDIGSLQQTIAISKDDAIEQIVIVEDDPDWRKAILDLLSALGLSEIVVHADCVKNARKLLKKAPPGSIVLMDLGLPIEPPTQKDQILELDAGLKLIHDFSSSKHNFRFVIMTAAANYSDAVRDALSAGVTAWDYIQKGTDWYEQLQARIQMAMQPRDYHAPRIQIKKSTSRLVYINNIEIELDRKPYIVCEYLASRAPRWCDVDQIRLDLSEVGPQDITPAMSKDDADKAAKGEIPYPTPFELLSEARLQDYVYDLRRAIEDRLSIAGVKIPVDELVQSRENPSAYRINTNKVEIFDGFEGLVSQQPHTSVLVVEDDSNWSALISGALKNIGFDVRTARTLADAKREISQAVPDFISLDLEIPLDTVGLESGLTDSENSLKLLDWLKDAASTTRVAVLSSIAWKDDVMLKILHHGIFIHDYISKRWDDPVERLIKSLWRMMVEEDKGGVFMAGAGEDFKLHNIEIRDLANGVFTVDDVDVKLTGDQVIVFKLLFENRNTPVDRNKIIDTIWPDPDKLPDDCEGRLNKIIQRIRIAINEATGSSATGNEVICGKAGVYWLQGVIKYGCLNE